MSIEFRSLVLSGAVWISYTCANFAEENFLARFRFSLLVTRLQTLFF